MQEWRLKNRARKPMMTMVSVRACIMCTNVTTTMLVMVMMIMMLMMDQDDD